MVQEQNPVELRPINALGHLVHRTRQNKARHNIGHNKHIGAVEIPNTHGAIRCIHDGDDGVSMGVIDKFERDNGVENGLDGRRRCARIKQRAAQGLDHIAITQGCKIRQAPCHIETNRCETWFFNRTEIPATPFDIEHVVRIAKNIGGGGFHRGIAATM